MRRYSMAVSVLTLLLLGAVASSPALAQRNGHGGGVRFGISISAPLFAPRYYPARHYSYPAYAYRAPRYVYRAPLYASAYPAPAYFYPPVYPPQTYTYSSPAIAPPVTYSERSDPQVVAAPPPAHVQGDWYYCSDSDSFYPSVRECAGGWKRVPAQPPSS